MGVAATAYGRCEVGGDVNMVATHKTSKMGMVGRHALVIAGSLLVGAILFVASFVAMDFVWTHFVVTNPKDIGLGDGVMVVGGGFLFGTTLGLLGLGCMLYRYWPRR
ncbi:MAG TPA: hypothetical protein VIW67_11655 [Terriglobales bacterium]|jgi:hypothetical protein